MKVFLPFFFFFYGTSIPGSVNNKHIISTDFVIDFCPEVIHCIESESLFEGVMQSGELNKFQK